MDEATPRGLITSHLKDCPVCRGRGYRRCECWPGDCICGLDDIDCEECGGDGLIDISYDYDWPFPSPQGEANG